MSNFQNVYSAEFIRYNANAAGRSTGDCVKRALSLAFDVPYNEMAKELIAKMKELHQEQWNIRYVYEKVIKAHGGSDEAPTPDPMMKLSEFADTIGKKGTWLVATGSKPNRSNHIVCIIDGTIYDSWDSTEEYVVRYHSVKNAPKRQFTGFDVMNYREEIENTVSEIGTKLVQKYPWYEYLRSLDAKFTTFRDNKYKCNIRCKLVLKARPYFDEGTTYNFEFAVVFTPSTTDDDAHKIIISTVKTRMYDRLYSINQLERKKEEAFQAGGTTKMDRWMSPLDERFYNSLPGRLQGIIVYVDVDRPGRYSDSYSVRVKPQHGEHDESIRLYAPDAAEMKELIEHYVETGETYLPY